MRAEWLSSENSKNKSKIKTGESWTHYPTSKPDEHTIRYSDGSSETRYFENTGELRGSAYSGKHLSELNGS